MAAGGEGDPLVAYCEGVIPEVNDFVRRGPDDREGRALDGAARRAHHSPR